MPSKLLEKLGDEGKSGHFYIARGVGKCLSVYTESGWEKEALRLQSLDLNIQSNLMMVRDFFHDAAEASLDSADRISLTQMQRQTIELNDEAVIFTFLDRIEIWSKENYVNRRNLQGDDYGNKREEALVKKSQEEDE